MICVYGNSGLGSFATVSQGMKEAAEQCGLLADFVLLDEVSQISDEPLGPSSEAPLAIVCGDPGYLNVLQSAAHKLKYLVLAPNSNGIYQAIVDYVSPRVDGLIAPSQWAAGVLRKHFPNHDVVVSPHGVACEFRFGENASLREYVGGKYRDGDFYVLHLTNTATSRKGTWQLVQAWSALDWGDSAKLLIYCHPEHMMQYSRLVDGVQNVGLALTMSITNYELYLSMSSAHVVCQPSRAEGFGLIPLEARCSGVPVVMTGCTGHSEHIAAAGYAGVVEVQSGADDLVEDYPQATAPTVEVEAVAAALEKMRSTWEQNEERLRQHSRSLADDWSWRAQNESTIRRLVEKAKRA
jgi:glycosyltransferase involved in cell wall biosynthesis